MEEAAGVTLTSVISNISTVFQGAVGWVGDVADAVVAHPLLLVGTLGGFAFMAVRLFKRLAP